MLVKVLVPGLLSPLIYAVSCALENYVDVGFQVSIPLGSRIADGWVIETDTSSGFNVDGIKNIKNIISARRVFATEQLDLFQWIADYYCCSLVEVIENSIPLVPLRKKIKELAQLRAEGALEKDQLAFGSESFATSVAVSNAVGSNLTGHNLTQFQSNAISTFSDAIIDGKFDSFLLYGVTGSGKTEVYINCINKALQIGKAALAIVPEIALTPQLLRNFTERIQVDIGVLHSRLSKGERWETWQKILDGRVAVAIGARSAIFAPFCNLGVIIVDEEHESSYKQSDGLRYNARDIAIIRARSAPCPVILGSATPSFESLVNVRRGKYKIIELPERVTNRPLPAIKITDLTKIKKRDMLSPNISPELFDSLSATFGRGEQAVILYNKRGFSSFLLCSSCGEVTQCPNCAVSLTFHKNKNRLVCHYCDYKIPTMEFCQKCRNPRNTLVLDEKGAQSIGQMIHCGGGTERIEEEILSLFPKLRILRMDKDTVSRKDAHTTILNKMRNGEADLLLGTQMIAKGHDLARVTLVGIIDADVGLHLPDFRANERIFQLITQAAGRAGRSELPGSVVIQTRQANHPTIVAIATGRFFAFARYELEFRERLKYPPFFRMMRIVISCPNRELAAISASTIAEKLKQSSFEFIERKNDIVDYLEVLGASQAPIERIKTRYRYNIIIKSSSSKMLSAIGMAVLDMKRKIFSKKKDDIRITIDIDPVDML